MYPVVVVLVALVVVSLAATALIVIEFRQRARGGRGLPVLCTLPSRRRSPLHV